MNGTILYLWTTISNGQWFLYTQPRSASDGRGKFFQRGVDTTALSGATVFATKEDAIAAAEEMGFTVLEG